MKNIMPNGCYNFSQFLDMAKQAIAGTHGQADVLKMRAVFDLLLLVSDGGRKKNAIVVVVNDKAIGTSGPSDDGNVTFFPDAMT